MTDKARTMTTKIEIKLGFIIEQKIMISDSVLENKLETPVPVWLLVVDGPDGSISAIVPNRETALAKAADLVVVAGAQIVHVDDEPTVGHQGTVQ